MEDLAAFARNHRRMLRDNPWAVTPLIGHPYPGALAMPIGESRAAHPAACRHHRGRYRRGLQRNSSSELRLVLLRLAREAADAASGGGAVQLPPAAPEFQLTAAVAVP
ncbi:hypothetical protein LJR078_003240 [Arthrobacter sp. LjRoot78]|uniref:hypothetical protein n=1 Tax=Arthrobacter sp. LjRoot78 TaxID=3342338 RepID=UPI003ECDA86D